MNFVVDDIGAVVAGMRTEVDGPPYYMYGHPIEIVNRVKEKSQDAEEKYRKYPMIFCRTDVKEKFAGAKWEYSMTIFIVAYTELNYNSEERKINVFAPVLYPLYESFMKGLRTTGLFQLGKNLLMPEHEKWDRFFWGSQFNMNNTASVLEDPLDAIEIGSLKLLQFNRQIC